MNLDEAAFGRLLRVDDVIPAMGRSLADDGARSAGRVLERSFLSYTEGSVEEFERISQKSSPPRTGKGVAAQ